MPAQGTMSRQRILDRVTGLFVSRGYHGVGVQEISDAVGLKRGALYHHIGSKEELLYEISMSLLRSASAMAEEVAATSQTPDVKLRDLARALMRHHADHGEGWAVAVREARFLSQAHQAEVIGARDAFESIWRQVLDEGAALDLWRPVDDIDVRGILGLFNAAARWYRPDGRLSPDVIADRYIALLLDGLRPRV